MTVSADRPYPPFELASRVFAVTGWPSDPYRAYEELGAQTKRAIVRLLPDDWSWEGKRVLDYGSGAGRTLRHFLRRRRRRSSTGRDIDAPSIEWLNENLSPPLHGWACAAAPVGPRARQLRPDLRDLGLHPPHRQRDPVVPGAPPAAEARRAADRDLHGPLELPSSSPASPSTRTVWGATSCRHDQAGPSAAPPC